MASSRTSLPQLFGELAEGQRVLAEALELPQFRLLATETLVMALLESYPTRTPTDLSQLTGLSRGRITHLITSLGKKEYVMTRKDPEDKRRTIISVTPSGKEASVASLARVVLLEEELVSRLSAPGVDMLAQHLSLIRRMDMPKNAPAAEEE